MRPAARVRLFPAWLLAAALAAGVVAGCSTEAPPPQPVVRKPAPKAEASPPAAQKGAEPQKKAESAALYDPRGKRDPFLSFVREATPQQGKADLAALPPIQRYELGELKLVGVLWTKKGAKALVEDAEGKGYSVTTGSRIGRSGGVVTRITEKELFVREEYVGYQGEKLFRENTMQLTTAGGK
jgi:type IV pilus assembly protein PilP